MSQSASAHDMFSFIEPPTLVIGKKPSSSGNNNNSTLTPTGLLLSSPHLFLMENDFQSLIQSTSTPTSCSNNILINNFNSCSQSSGANGHHSSASAADLINQHHLFLLQTPTSPTPCNTADHCNTINTNNINSYGVGGLLSPDFDQNPLHNIQSTNSVVTPTTAANSWLQQQLCDIIDDVFPEADQILNNMNTNTVNTGNDNNNTIDNNNTHNNEQVNVVTNIPASTTSILSVLLNNNNTSMCQQNVSPINVLNNNMTVMQPSTSGKVSPMFINTQCMTNQQPMTTTHMINNVNTINTPPVTSRNTSPIMKPIKKSNKKKSISPTTSTISNATHMSTKSFFNTNIDPSAFYYGTSGFLKFHDYSGRLNHSKKKNHSFNAAINGGNNNNGMMMMNNEKIQKQNKMSQMMMNNSASSSSSTTTSRSNMIAATQVQQTQHNIYDEMKFKSACPNQVFYKM